MLLPPAPPPPFNDAGTGRDIKYMPETAAIQIPSGFESVGDQSRSDVPQSDLSHVGTRPAGTGIADRQTRRRDGDDDNDDDGERRWKKTETVMATVKMEAVASRIESGRTTVVRQMMADAAGDGPDAVCRSDAMQVSGGAGM